MNMPQLIGSVTVGERGQVVIPSKPKIVSINTGKPTLIFKAPVDGVLIVPSQETFEETTRPS